MVRSCRDLELMLARSPAQKDTLLNTGAAAYKPQDGEADRDDHCVRRYIHRSGAAVDLCSPSARFISKLNLRCPAPDPLRTNTQVQPVKFTIACASLRNPGNRWSMCRIGVRALLGFVLVGCRLI